MYRRVWMSEIAGHDGRGAAWAHGMNIQAPLITSHTHVTSRECSYAMARDLSFIAIQVCNIT